MVANTQTDGSIAELHTPQEWRASDACIWLYVADLVRSLSGIYVGICLSMVAFSVLTHGALFQSVWSHLDPHHFFIYAAPFIILSVLRFLGVAPEFVPVGKTQTIIADDTGLTISDRWRDWSLGWNDLERVTLFHDQRLDLYASGGKWLQISMFGFSRGTRSEIWPAS